MPEFRAKKRSRKKRPGRRRLYTLILGVSLVVILVAAYVMLASAPGKKGDAQRQTSKPPVGRRIEQQKTAPAQKTATTREPQEKCTQKPRLAIIIDDMGYSEETGKKLLALDLELSFAFLPSAPHTADLLQIAARAGRDILLHLPLEAEDKGKNGSPGTLTRTMSETELAGRFQAALAAVPQAVGLNNHMGSKFTADPAAMGRLLTLARDRHLFFIDSLTSPESSGCTIARKLGMKTARRDFFIDNEQEEGAIMSQLESLIRLAEKRGEAIAIGHPHPETLKALILCQDQLAARVQLTPISTLAH